MHVVAILDHPYGASAHANEPHRRSFSAALLRAALDGITRAGGTSDVIDLVTDGFDPVMRAEDLADWRRGGSTDPQVLDYQRRLASADHLVLVFPTWWMSMPAGTKGFLDKVLAKGVAFDEPRPGGALVRRLTRLRGVTVLTPMTTRHGLYRLFFGRPGHRILFRGAFALIGVRGLRWFSFEGPAQRSAAWRSARLARVQLLRALDDLVVSESLGA